MNTNQCNKYEMYCATLAWLESLPRAGLPPAFGAKLDDFREKVTGLSRLANIQSTPTGGIIATREAALDEAETAAVAVGGLVQSFAHARRRHDLAARAHITRSHFHQTARVLRLTLARRVHAAAMSVVDEATDYGLTRALIDDLGAKIDRAAHTLVAPRMSVVRRKAATARVAATIAEIDLLLRHELDPLLRGLARADPSSEQGYRRARRIIHRGGPRRKSAVEVAPRPSAKPASAAAANPVVPIHTAEPTSPSRENKALVDSPAPLAAAEVVAPLVAFERADAMRRDAQHGAAAPQSDSVAVPSRTAFARRLYARFRRWPVPIRRVA